jgi:mycofactocin precursor
MNEPEPSAPIVQAAPDASEVIERDDLVEEVSIDGMCGVY